MPTPIDAHIDARPEAVRSLLRRIRDEAVRAAPEAEEIISYQMPALRQGGVLIYFDAFKTHVGVYPPISGDAALEVDLAPFRGPKGNLRFPLDEPFPLDLIGRIVRLQLAKVALKQATRKQRTARAKIAD